MKISTSRLSLHDLAISDAELIFPEITMNLTKHWIDWEPPINVEDLRENISRSNKTNRPNLIAFTKKSKEFVGCCSISKTDFGDFEANVWVRENMQGKGFGIEMTKLLISWAKKEKYPYLVYSVTEGNEASKSIVEKIGSKPFRTWEAKKRNKKRKVQDYKIELGN